MFERTWCSLFRTTGSIEVVLKWRLVEAVSMAMVEGEGTEPEADTRVVSCWLANDLGLAGSAVGCLSAAIRDWLCDRLLSGILDQRPVARSVRHDRSGISKEARRCSTVGICPVTERRTLVRVGQTL